VTARLPIIGSTAKSTAFVSERLDGLGGTHLFLDGNGKITAGNGTLANPKPNAFSLVQVSDCPGSTETCRASCYVHPLQSAQPDLHALYVHNSTEIRRILDDKYLANDWAMRLAHWITQSAREGFRWHVSGDVFSLEYAQWIADVCRESPRVRSWIYTRSFQHLAPLAEVSTVHGGNLALNLSADKDNYDAARDAAVKYRHPQQSLRLCYLTTGEPLPALADGDTVFPDYALRPRQHSSFAESEWWQSLSKFERGLVCPVDSVGKAENRRCGFNACSRCMD
jgi:hypothetical protein